MNFSQPVIKVSKFAECVHFYHQLLGMELVSGSTEGPVAALESGGRRLTLLDERAMPANSVAIYSGEQGAPTITLAFNTDDLDGEFIRLSEAGVKFMVEPHDFVEWSVRSSICADPEGNPVEIVSTVPIHAS